MKKLFYGSTVIVIIAIVVGMIMPENRNARDFIYLLIMLLMFLAITSGVAYIVEKIDKK